MSWIKNFLLLSVSISFCFCLLVIGDWLLTRQINQAIENQIENSEAEKIIETRQKNEDIPQKAELVSQGFLPVLYPYLIDMDTLDVQFPLIAGLPSAKTYYCNEGYGLVKYKSDRFGFRNIDTIWDNNPQAIMIGDSFVHGACVSDEETLPKKLSNEINSNVLNLGIGSNGPSHYVTYAYLFIPRLKPKTVYLNFYPNDNGVLEKSIIERRNVELNQQIYAKNALSLIDTSLYFEQGMEIIDFLRGNKTVKKKSFADRVIDKLKTHSTFPAIKTLLGLNQDFKQTEHAIINTLKLCNEFDCKLIVSFIPNSEFYRPDPRSDNYADAIKHLTSKLGVRFVDGREFLNRKKDSADFAIKGPHLSPTGYEKMAKEIGKIK
ncbi:MAG: hypothetical protein VXA09_04635 [Burkholderiaceae bacterium]